jgi:hypothetical protein
MRGDDSEDRSNLNTGNPWSDIDLLDLANCLRLQEPVDEIATFLCRSRREVRDKIAELQQSGELTRIVAEAAADAQPG